MAFRRLLRLKDINMWFLASAVALNVFWTLLVTVVFSLLFLRGMQGADMVLQALMIAASFLGPFLTGWIVGTLARDSRGPAYGMVGSLGSIVVLLFVAVPTAGLFGLMMVIVAAAGGFNGGMISLRGRLHE